MREDGDEKKKCRRTDRDERAEHQKLCFWEEKVKEIVELKCCSRNCARRILRCGLVYDHGPRPHPAQHTSAGESVSSWFSQDLLDPLGFLPAPLLLRPHMHRMVLIDLLMREEVLGTGESAAAAGILATDDGLKRRHKLLIRVLHVVVDLQVLRGVEDTATVHTQAAARVLDGVCLTLLPTVSLVPLFIVRDDDDRAVWVLAADVLVQRVFQTVAPAAEGDGACERRLVLPELGVEFGVFLLDVVAKVSFPRIHFCAGGLGAGEVGHCSVRVRASRGFAFA